MRTEVSDYDGHLYPLPNASSEPDTADCWTSDDGYLDGCWRATGAGGLGADWSWGAWRLEGTPPELQPREANCGTHCAEYVIEEWWTYGQVDQSRRRLIGRGVHNSSVVSNVSDPTRLQTMTLLPSSRGGSQHAAVFIGLGVCCELSECPTACQGHGGELSLVSYQADDYAPRVIMPISGSDASSDALAVRMGVAVDEAYPVDATTSARVSVWVGGQLLSYRVGFNGCGAPTLPLGRPLALCSSSLDSALSCRLQVRRAQPHADRSRHDRRAEAVRMELPLTLRLRRADHARGSEASFTACHLASM